MEYKTISENLCRIRKANRISQASAAKSAGITRLAYRNIENGSSVPRVSTLQNLAAGFNVKLTDLLAPTRKLTHVRFRTSADINNRQLILSAVAQWMENFDYLETLMNCKTNYVFSDFTEKIICDLTGVERAKFVADLARKYLNLSSIDSIIDICALMEKNGIKIHTIKLASKGFLGLSVSDMDGGPAIIVNSWDRLSVECSIFSVAHELAHLLLHLDSFDVDDSDYLFDQEREANVFASYFLMPSAAFTQVWENSSGLSFVNRVIKIKHFFQVSYKTVLDRLAEIYGLDFKNKFYASINNKPFSSQFNLEKSERFDIDDLYKYPEIIRAKEPDPLSSIFFMEERLSKLVRIGIEKKQISMGRGAEILGCKLEDMRDLIYSWV
jgi:Zn-dependent peptidase ImmA (M78 family)/transcriptional regulator with XRE-family HTH domain